MTWDRTKPRDGLHGAAHTKARKQWAARHRPSNPCVRCGLPLGPMGPWLHLDHDDVDKTLYRGFAHASCNTSAGGTRGRQVQRAKRTGQPADDPQQPYTRPGW